MESLSRTLLDQLENVFVVLKDTDDALGIKLVDLNKKLSIANAEEPISEHLNSLTDNTLDSSPMPEEELVEKKFEKVSQEIVQNIPQTFATIETQTGQSLRSPEPVKVDVSVLCIPPNNVEVQTDTQITKPTNVSEKLKITQFTSGDQETIEIDSRPIIEEPDDDIDNLLIEANYQGNEMDNSKNTILNITHTNPHGFETVLIEPDETTTEVIVDSDGTKRIIVRKVRKTLISRQQTISGHQQIIVDPNIKALPGTDTFSQITLQGEKSSLITTEPDGTQKTTQTQNYGGQVISGLSDGEVTIQEFTSKPECQITFSEGATPAELLDQGFKCIGGDPSLDQLENIKITGLDEPEIHTSSASVKAVVQQVTRRIIRRTRRIIKRVTIIDGKEHVTEEVVEEPEEIDVTEEEIPRVTINVTRTINGQIVNAEEYHPPEPGEASAVEFVDNNKQIIEEVERNVNDTVNFEHVDRVDEINKLKDVPQHSKSSPIEKPIKDDKIVQDDNLIPTAIEKSSEIQVIEMPQQETIIEVVDIPPEKIEEELISIPETQSEKPKQLSNLDLNAFLSAERSIATGEICLPVQEKQKTVTEILEESKSLETIVEKKEISKEKQELPKDILETPTKPHVTFSPEVVLENKEIHIDRKSPQKIEVMPEAMIGDVSIPEVIDDIEIVDLDLQKLADDLVTEIETSVNKISIPSDTNVDDIPISEKEIQETTVHEPDTSVVESEKSEIPQPMKNTLVKQHAISSSDKIQIIDFDLSIQEKPIGPAITSDNNPTLSFSVEHKKEGDIEKQVIIKEVTAELPFVHKTTTSDMTQKSPIEVVLESDVSKSEYDDISPRNGIEIGGKRNRKRKKHKMKEDSPPFEEINIPQEIVEKTSLISPDGDGNDEKDSLSVHSSLVESVDIIIPEESIKESPKVFEQFEVDVLDSLSPREDVQVNETGYEPEEITTADDNSELIQKISSKPKHKSKRRQKVKSVPEEQTEIPKSLTEEDNVYSDEDEIKILSLEPSDKQQKRKKKSKKDKSSDKDKSPEKEKIIEEVSVEKEIEEPSDPTVLEEKCDEIPEDESYKTISEKSDDLPVKIVEEAIPTEVCSPELPDMPKELVYPVSILEDIQTVEQNIQTQLESPVDPSLSFIEVEKAEISMQTSPELTKEISDTSVQTSICEPTTILEQSQQTSPVPENEYAHVDTQVSNYDIAFPEAKSSQTSSPLPVEVTNIDLQTISPDVAEQFIQTSPLETPLSAKEVIETLDTSMQTPLIETSEQTQQTSPHKDMSEIKEICETIDVAIQSEDVQLPHEISDESTQVEMETKIPTSEISIQTSTPVEVEIMPVVQLETTEFSTQTSPRKMPDLSDDTISSSSVSKEEPYEVHFHAQITIPNQKSSNTDITREFLLQESNRQVPEDSIQTELRPDDDDENMLFEEDIIMDKNKRVKKRKRNKRKPITGIEDKNDAETLSDPVTSDLSLSLSLSSNEQAVTNKDISADEGISPHLSQTPVAPSESMIFEERKPEPSNFTNRITYSEITKRSKSPTPEKMGDFVQKQPEDLCSLELQPKQQKQPDKYVHVADLQFKITTSIPGESICVEPSIQKPSEALLDSEKNLMSLVPKTTNKLERSDAFIMKEKIIPGSDIKTLLNKTHDNIEDKIKNMNQNRKSKNYANVLTLTKVDDANIDIPAEQYDSMMKNHFDDLKTAINSNNTVVIETTIVTTVETIIIWLEKIEYKIYQKRQQMNEGPNKEVVDEVEALKDELGDIDANVKTLKTVLQSLKDPDIDRSKINECLESLKEQVDAVENITRETGNQANLDNCRWEEFLNDAKNIQNLVSDGKHQLDEIIASDIPNKIKLEQLDQIENSNSGHMLKSTHLLQNARSLARDFPSKEIPNSIFTTHDTTKQIENTISLERERLLQLLALADEYEQTLREFEQITDVADALVDSRLTVFNLEHLQEEIQKHRKFFVNLSHCRAILESLEGNLDNETRALHAALHQSLHDKATIILDKAASRAQKMALAASRWTLLEQGMKDERQWLQVAHQRVPDLSNVTSADYDQYINMYQSLLLDISHHHAKLLQLLSIADGLQKLVNCSGLHGKYNEPLEVVVKLQDDVSGHLRRLIAFKENWTEYDHLTDRLEHWIKVAEKEIANVTITPDVCPPGNMRQFWELKAQHEVHNNIRNNAAVQFEHAMEIIPVSDEMVQRQFFSKVEEKWKNLTSKIDKIHGAAIQSISAPDAPIDEKLSILEEELRELKLTLSELQGVIKTDDELNLYIERLQVLSGRIDTIQNELGHLGLLPALESERVGSLLSQAHRLEILISEELEGGLLLKEKLAAIQVGLSKMRRNHQKVEQALDECESNEKMGSDVVEQALITCQCTSEDLVIYWQDLMALRQLLHTLPVRLRASVSPVKVEREISHLQDNHSALESRCGNLTALLRNRLGLWRRFERQLEMVQQSVQEADFMIELLTVQGQVDYDRLLKATERLEVS